MKQRDRQRLIRYYDASAEVLDEKKKLCSLDEVETTTIVESVRSVKAVLDVGCGTGVLLNQLDIPLRVGVDLSLSMLKIARDRISRRSASLLVLADGSLLPFKDNSFERVTCQDVIGHMDDPASIIFEMLRVCRPTGKVIITFQRKTIPTRLLSAYIGRKLSVPLYTHREIDVEKIFENYGASIRSRRLIDHSIVMIEAEP